jgi:hypothetical protein
LYSIWYLIIWFPIKGFNSFIYKCFAFLNRTVSSWSIRKMINITI